MVDTRPVSEAQQRKINTYLKIAEKVRTGEYYREGRRMYDLKINDPMSERYVYVFITGVSLLILLMAVNAVNGLYPLESSIPISYLSTDFYELMPHIKGLQAYKNEDPSEAMLRFLVNNYVMQREEYDIQLFDRDVNGIKSQSSDKVFREFQQYIDPHNSESPIKLYQRHSKRRISILSLRRTPEGMEVYFEAMVDGRTDVKKSHWRVNIGFQYTGIALDEKTDTVKPMTFLVTEYHSKRLQDIK